LQGESKKEQIRKGATMSDTMTTAPPTPGTYAVDRMHSEVGFVARHLVGSKVRGRFGEFEGTITIADPPENSSFEARVDASSITTGVLQRDEDLRSNNFLDIPNYPEMTMKSTKVEKVSDRQWKVTADLTLRGVTKPVVLDLEYFGSGPGLAPGSTVAGFSASTEIDRRDFGITFSAALDTGGLVVGNKVRIEIELETALQK
jgi:polyisoprenoid-binding protein YceI